MKREAEADALKDLIPFDLDKEFDQETYFGRFQLQQSRLNPILFFNSDKTIKEANDMVLKYRLRKDASDKLG